MPFLVHQVLGGPIPVAVGTPGAEAVVLGNGVLQAVLLGAIDHVLRDLFKLELRGMDAHNDQALVSVFGVPVRDVGKGADAVHAGIGPEVYQDYLAPQALHSQGV